MKFFVVSDVHSFWTPLKEALDNAGFDINNPEHHLVVCGDLFDRGPDTKLVFALAKQLADDGRLQYICGNHEELLLECINEIRRGCFVSSHHLSNGTATTIADFSGINYYDIIAGTCDIEKFNEKIFELEQFVINQCVDYGEVGDNIFVHGWIPNNTIFPEGDWSMARWRNGMALWKKGIRLEGKTIFCGHWHCSWGHSHIHQASEEFPQKNQANWQESFVPFVDNGIVALDACTAYSGLCNCWVIEIEQ